MRPRHSMGIPMTQWSAKSGWVGYARSPYRSSTTGVPRSSTAPASPTPRDISAPSSPGGMR